MVGKLNKTENGFYNYDKFALMLCPNYCTCLSRWIEECKDGLIRLNPATMRGERPIPRLLIEPRHR